MSAFDRETYDELYRSAPALWSGRPNRQLVVEAEELPPGTALDAGSGEGGDALWLAERGWRVLAVDFSAVAVERAAARADVERRYAEPSGGPASGWVALWRGAAGGAGEGGGVHAGVES